MTEDGTRLKPVGSPYQFLFFNGQGNFLKIRNISAMLTDNNHNKTPAGRRACLARCGGMLLVGETHWSITLNRLKKFKHFEWR